MAPPPSCVGFPHNRVTDPAYVCEILDRLLTEHPRLYGMMLYIEQPFPYDLDAHRIEPAPCDDQRAVLGELPVRQIHANVDQRVCGFEAHGDTCGAASVRAVS